MSVERDPDLPEAFYIRHDGGEERAGAVFASDGSDVSWESLPPELKSWMNRDLAKYEMRRLIQEGEYRDQEGRSRAAARPSRYGQFQHPSQRRGRGR